MKRAVVLVAMLAGIVSTAAQSDPAWRQPFDPLRLVGNIRSEQTCLAQLQQEQRP